MITSYVVNICFQSEDKMIGLIDMHCHILPGVDDGSENMEQTISMLKIAYEDGTRKIIATPHYHIGRMISEREKCHKELSNIRQKIKEMGMEMEIYPGNEIYYFSEAMEKVAEKKIDTLADSSYILLEFEPKVDYHHIQRAINDVGGEGYVPVIAHVERYNCLSEKPERCFDMVEHGALLQVNASSVIGRSGKDSQRFIKKLMKERAVAFVASDAHSDIVRRPMLKEAYTYVSKKFGKDYADDIFSNNQLKLIADERI